MPASRRAKLWKCLSLRRATQDPCGVLQAVDLGHLGASFAASQAAEREAGGAEAAEVLRDTDIQTMDSISDGEEMRWIQTGFRLVAEVWLCLMLSTLGRLRRDLYACIFLTKS